MFGRRPHRRPLRLAHTHSHPDGNSHLDPHSHADFHRYPHPHPDAHAHPDAHTHPNSHAQPHTDRDRDPHVHPRPPPPPPPPPLIPPPGGGCPSRLTAAMAPEQPTSSSGASTRGIASPSTIATIGGPGSTSSPTPTAAGAG